MMALDLVEAYASLFVHCWEQYAVQQRDGSYWRVDEPLTLPLLAGHLAGRWTLGTYLLDKASCCAFAVFDADSANGLAHMVMLSMELAGQGISTILETSRRGGHLWFHLAEPAPASLVRAWLLPYAVSYGVEFYPKQEVLPAGGCGSLIRLPLGVHRRSRGWYPFVQVTIDGQWVPVGNTIGDCCAWVLQSVQRVAVPETVSMMTVGGSHGEERGSLPAPMASHMSGICPGQGSIRAWCRAQDILVVIGRHVVLDSRGVCSCPFQEHHRRGDMHPSFQVFGGENPHWYCYTWGRAGDLFDFLCLYYHLSQDEAWRRLQEGTLG